MFFRRIAMTLLVASTAAAPGIFAQTATTNTREITIGPVGVGSTETIQVNVVNLASNSSTTAASCTGSITLDNATGNAIGTSTSFTVTAGQIFSTSLPFSKIASSGTRAEVVAVISQTEPTSTSSSSTVTPCDLHFSVETYDTTTGATHVSLSGAGGGYGPGGGGPGR
jgi:hypothetical protein